MTRWIIALVAMSFLSASAMAGVTGKIVGQIVDKDGSGGLPGANVVVLGLPSVFGATSDPEGNFAILNVPAGTFDVKCSFIGYRDVVLKGIKVLPDLTTEVDFVLEEQVLEAEAIEVVAVRPLVQKDNTSSMRLVTSEETRIHAGSRICSGHVLAGGRDEQEWHTLYTRWAVFRSRLHRRWRLAEGFAIRLIDHGTEQWCYRSGIRDCGRI